MYKLYHNRVGYLKYMLRQMVLSGVKKNPKRGLELQGIVGVVLLNMVVKEDCTSKSILLPSEYKKLILW